MEHAAEVMVQTTNQQPPSPPAPVPCSGAPSVAAAEDRKLKNRREELLERTVPPEQRGIKVLWPREGNDETDHDIDLDIVAVHGLGANPDATWVHKGTKAKWLEDDNMLPSVFPNSRIMRFGYDSKWFGPNAVSTSLTSTANSLLHALSDKREDCEDRPLVFIGHCFGGLVVEEAFNKAKSHEDEHPGIWNSTVGVLLFGTPHGGAKSLETQSQLLDAIRAAKLETEDRALQPLREGNEFLVNVVRNFTKYVSTKQPRPHIFSFYEEKPTPIKRVIGEDGPKEFTVSETSGVLQWSKYQGLPLDHFSLTKFKGPDDDGFVSAAREIKKMAKVAKKAGGGEMKSSTTTKLPGRKPSPKLPFAKDPNFISSEMLDRISQKFEKRVKVVLCGVPGSGKTHIAIQYAHKFIDEQHHETKVFWVNARSPEQLRFSCDNIRTKLRIPLPDKANTTELILTVFRYLKQEAAGHWLMVLDGLDPAEPGIGGDAANIAQETILNCIPQSVYGKVLITTRDLSLASKLVAYKLDSVIETDHPPENELAQLLFCHRVTKTSKVESALVTINALKRSPQAVALASSYLRADGVDISPRKYVERLRSKVAHDVGDAQNTTGEPRSHQDAVTSAWQMLHSLLRRERPSAAELMLFIGIFDVQTIKEFFLMQTTNSASESKADIALLVKYGLIRQSTDHMDVSANGMIQQAVRDYLATRENKRTSVQERALVLMETAFPAAKTEEFITCQHLYPSAIAVLRFVPNVPSLRSPREELLFKMAGYARHLHQHQEAIKYLEECATLQKQDPEKGEALAETARLVEEIHREIGQIDAPGESESASHVRPGVPTATKGIGIATLSKVLTLRKIHHRPNSVARLKQELEKCEQELGKDSEETVREATKLATALHERDPESELISVSKRILKWCEATYGADHLDTIRQRTNLALAYNMRGRYDRAEELYRSACKDAEGLLGPGSQEVLRMMSALAIVYAKQGKTDAAAKTLRVVQAGQETQFGLDHPYTLATSQNAALILQELGDLETAEQELYRVLDTRARLLGEDHESTLQAACSLALNYRLQRRYEESERLYIDVEKGQVAAAGSEPTRALSTTRLMLGELYEEIGRVAEAKKAFMAAMGGFSQMLGGKHDQTRYAKDKLRALEKQKVKTVENGKARTNRPAEKPAEAGV